MKEFVYAYELVDEIMDALKEIQELKQKEKEPRQIISRQIVSDMWLQDVSA